MLTTLCAEAHASRGLSFTGTTRPVAGGSVPGHEGAKQLDDMGEMLCRWLAGRPDFNSDGGFV